MRIEPVPHETARVACAAFPPGGTDTCGSPLRGMRAGQNLNVLSRFAATIGEPGHLVPFLGGEGEIEATATRAVQTWYIWA